MVLQFMLEAHWQCSVLCSQIVNDYINLCDGKMWDQHDRNILSNILHHQVHENIYSCKKWLNRFIFYFSHILQRCYSLSDTQIEVFLRHLSNFAQDSGSSATRIEITRYLHTGNIISLILSTTETNGPACVWP